MQPQAWSRYASLALAAGCLCAPASAQESLLERMHGSHAMGRFGWTLCDAGDADGDGSGDLAIGAFREANATFTNVGRVYLVDGRTGELRWSTSWNSSNAWFGYSLARVGDIDGDGHDDLLVGAPQTVASGSPPGFVALLSGADGSVLATYVGTQPRELYGWAVAGLGDVDHDGVPDFAVAARDATGPAGLGDALGNGCTVLAIGIPLDDTLALNGGAVELHSGCACSVPQTYCIAHANSVGAGARIGRQGLPSVAWNQFGLSVSGGPPGESALCFYGPHAQQQPFGIGFLCVAPGNVGIRRLKPILTFDASGAAFYPLDFGAPPANQPPAEILPGTTWYFQYWYRDPDFPGGGGFNLSDGIEIVFCP